ncbi:hypothetical protein ACFB49_45900 [Sphingomonas sp. DBB INV C78]|uniref:oligosaccharide flippase family protein n=1 Tax=Sphingomonas sp. DBB INV C78 TaxID=3349434 RepID=UPI0036D420E2
MNASRGAPANRHVARLLELAARPSSLILVSLIIQNGLRLISSAILTRLLDVHDFGVMGIIVSWTVILVMVSDIGFFSLITRDRRFSDSHFLDAIWSFRVIRGFVLAVAMGLLCLPIASFSGKPEIAAPLMVSSLVLIFEGAQSLFYATGPRQGRLLQLTILEISCAVFQLFFTIGLALLMPSYWALVWGYIASTGAKAVGSFLVSGTRRRFRIDMPIVRELIRDGRPFFVSSVATVFVRQIDKVLLSRFMLLAQFGLYTLASNLLAFPITVADSYSRRSLYVAYVDRRAEDSGPIHDFYRSFGRNFTRLYIMGVAALTGAAEAITHILYDSRYWNAATYMYLLAPSIFLRLPASRIEQYLLAHGEDWPQSVANLIRAGWLVISLPLAYSHGGQFWMIAVIGLVEVPVYGYLTIRARKIAGGFHWREKIICTALAAVTLAAAVAASGLGLKLVEGQSFP